MTKYFNYDYTYFMLVYKENLRVDVIILTIDITQSTVSMKP